MMYKYNFKHDLQDHELASKFLMDVDSYVVERCKTVPQCGICFWYDIDEVPVRTYYNIPEELGTAIDTVMEIVYGLENLPIIGTK